MELRLDEIDYEEVNNQAPNPMSNLVDRTRQQQNRPRLIAECFRGRNTEEATGTVFRAFYPSALPSESRYCSKNKRKSAKSTSEQVWRNLSVLNHPRTNFALQVKNVDGLLRYSNPKTSQRFPELDPAPKID